MDWLDLLVGVARGIALLYAVPLFGLWLYARRHPDGMGRRGALRLLPDLLRTQRRLVSDRDLPARARVGVLLLLVYLASPIDLVPYFLPVLGYVDDVLIVAWALWWLIRAAGPSALRRQWAGTGLRFVERLAGLFEPEHGWGPAAKTS